MATAAHEENRFVEVLGLTPHGVGLLKMVTRNDPRVHVAIQIDGELVAVSLDSLAMGYVGQRVSAVRVKDRTYPEPHKLGTTHFAFRRLATVSGNLKLLVCIDGVMQFICVKELVERGYLDREEGGSFSLVRDAEDFVEGAPSSAPTRSGTFVVQGGRLTSVG